MILPAYNEVIRIEETVNQTVTVLKQLTPYFEIVVIAENRSRERTDKIAGKLAKKYNYVKHLHSGSLQGRGKALTRAFKAFSGEKCFAISM